MSEVEVRSVVGTQVEEPDAEPSAPWDGLPELKLSTSGWYAGNVKTGMVAESPLFRLENTGDADLEILSVTPLAAPWSTSFDAELPLTLAPGSGYDFTFSFSPSATGVFERYFSVTTSAGTAAVRLGGDGVNTVGIRDSRADAGVTVRVDAGARCVRLSAAVAASYRLVGLSGQVGRQGRLAAGEDVRVELPGGVSLVHVTSAVGTVMRKVVLP